MASKAKGTAFRGPEAQVALRTGPAVAVGKYFVLHPDHGGYYTSDKAEVARIESDWLEMTPGPEDSPPNPGDSSSSADK